MQIASPNILFMNTDSLTVTLATAAVLASAVVIPLIAIIAGMRVYLKVRAYFQKGK